ncbi:MAG TPA: hypothetical protein VJ464_16870 [Blastocatellia bacterium]|nr:hypothetical protein [Blastocatellia bacterium]
MKAVHQFEARLAGDELLPMIERAVSRVADELREEVAQEMAIAALSGELSLSDIKSAVPFYRRKVSRQMADRFKFVSLDAVIPGQDGLTYADRLAG